MVRATFDTANREVAVARVGNATTITGIHEPLNGTPARHRVGRRLTRLGMSGTVRRPVATPQFGAPLHNPGQPLSTLCKDSSRRIA
jgi:hypothetical protein